MAKEEWILGQPVETQTVYEWVLGTPHIYHEAVVGGVKELAGTVAIVSTCVAEIRKTLALAGTVEIVSACVAELKRTRGLAGDVAIVSLVIGEISVVSLFKLLSGRVVIVSSVVGELLSIAKGRTYFTYENDKIVFYVAGLETMRIKPDGSIDVKGTVTENAF